MFCFKEAKLALIVSSMFFLVEPRISIANTGSYVTTIPLGGNVTVSGTINSIVTRTGPDNKLDSYLVIHSDGNAYNIAPDPDVDYTNQVPQSFITVSPDADYGPLDLKKYIGMNVVMSGTLTATNGNGPMLIYKRIELKNNN